MDSPREVGNDSSDAKSGEYNDDALRFWSIYSTEAHKYDVNIFDSWKANTDSTLIFAGLFSAIVTAFLIESGKLLKRDSGDASVALLAQLVSLQHSQPSNASTTVPIINPSTPFKPPTSAIVVNVLWFLSLGCSLGVALCITLVQQWLREYLQIVQKHTGPLRRARVRTFMFDGLKSWNMDWVVGVYIPIMLHSSLFLFFIGFCFYLFPTNLAVTWVIVAVSAAHGVLYIIATIAPIQDSAAPYQTPFSPLLWWTWRNVTQLQRAQRVPFNFNIDRDTFVTTSTPTERRRRDQSALQWACQVFSHDTELQPLVESIPGFLSSQDGRDVWDVASTPGQPVTQFGNRITRLLVTCLRPGLLDSESHLTRATVCLDALFAILQHTRGAMFFGYDLRHNLDRVAALRWNSVCPLERKAVCVKILLECRSPPTVKWKNTPLPISGYGFESPISRFTQSNQVIIQAMFDTLPLPHFITPATQYDLPLLLKKADHHLQVVDEHRCKMEELLVSSSDIGERRTLLGNALQLYIKALEDGNRDLYACTRVLQDFLSHAYPPQHQQFPLILTIFHWMLTINHDPNPVIYEGFLYLKDAKFAATFTAPRILAFLRRFAIYPPLPGLTAQPQAEHEPFSLLPIAKSKDEYLRRELLPVSMCLSILQTPESPPRRLFASSNMHWYARVWRPYIPWPKESELDIFTLLPNLFSALAGPRHPLGVLAYVLEDLKDGGRVLELASLVCAVKHEKQHSKRLDDSVINVTLDVLLKKWSRAWPYPSPGGPEEVEKPPWSPISPELHSFIWNIRGRRREAPPGRFQNQEARSFILCEGSQILLIGIVNNLVVVERSANRSAPCPFPKEAIDRVVELIREGVTLKLPIEIAEELFGIEHIVVDTNDQPEEATTI